MKSAHILIKTPRRVNREKRKKKARVFDPSPSIPAPYPPRPLEDRAVLGDNKAFFLRKFIFQPILKEKYS
jgi:hypothetical protein